MFCEFVEEDDGIFKSYDCRPMDREGATANPEGNIDYGEVRSEHDVWKTLVKNLYVSEILDKYSARTYFNGVTLTRVFNICRNQKPPFTTIGIVICNSARKVDESLDVSYYTKIKNLNFLFLL